MNMNQFLQYYGRTLEGGETGLNDRGKGYRDALLNVQKKIKQEMEYEEARMKQNKRMEKNK